MEDIGIIDEYRTAQRARGLSVATIRCYRILYTTFASWCARRGVTLTTVARSDIEAWLSLTPLSNRTRGLYVTRLDVLFRWMVDEELRDGSPCARIPKPKLPRSVPRPVPTAGLQTALELADDRTALMLCLAAYAGLRRAEIAALTREHVLDDRDPPLLLIWGKGSKERLVPIGPVVRDAMIVYGLPEHGPIFPGRDGCLSAQSVGLIISKHLRSCGVDATAHQGRHWFASQLYRTSGDLRVTQEMMGHASPSTTAVYAAWSPERAVTAIAALPSRPAPEAA